MFDTHSKWRKERKRTAKQNERLRSKIRSYVSFNWCSRKINVRICVYMYSVRSSILWRSHLSSIYDRGEEEQEQEKNKNCITKNSFSFTLNIDQKIVSEYHFHHLSAINVHMSIVPNSKIMISSNLKCVSSFSFSFNWGHLKCNPSSLTVSKTWK